MTAPLALDDGSAHDVAEWEAAAAGVLRKAGRMSEDDPDVKVWDRLGRTTLDGIRVTPLGTPALVAELESPVRPTRAGAWDVRPLVADNDEALADLRGGATSIWVDARTDLAPVLDGVLLDAAAVVLSDPAQADALVAAGELHPASNLGYAAHEATDAQAEQARSAGVRGFVVDTLEVHLAGASEAQALAWSLWRAAAYLRRVPDPALVEFRYAVTDDQLLSIATLRAARRLWARMLQLSGLGPAPQRQHAVTSAAMTSRYDPHTNLLRACVAAFSAGVGGADAITVLPYDEPRGERSAIGRRLARNLAHLLIEEAHVAAVADPAGGAYAVERLTDDLAQAAWAELRRLEEDGEAAFHDRVAEVAATRAEQVATRRRPITGLSEFPHLHEPPPAPVEGAGPRYGAAFEALRDEPTGAAVFLATMGPVAASTARAGFATNLLAAGGVDVVAAGATEGVDDVLAQYRAEGGPAVVCLAGTDRAYEEWGADLVAALREAGAEHVVLAGSVDLGADVGADETVAVGVDAVDFLTRVKGWLA